MTVTDFVYVCIYVPYFVPPRFGESGRNNFLHVRQPRHNLLMVPVCGYHTCVVFDVDNEVGIETSLPILISLQLSDSASSVFQENTFYYKYPVGPCYISWVISSSGFPDPHFPVEEPKVKEDKGLVKFL